MSGPIGVRAKVFEKDITLAVAKRLDAALRTRGVDVVMTRTTDTLIALSDRGRIANQRGGDVFVSIHVNAANLRWSKPAAARGYETYFLAEARTEDDRRVERMENESVRFETDATAERDDPLSFIINDMAQNEHLRESGELASLIQARLGTMHPGPSRGEASRLSRAGDGLHAGRARGDRIRHERRGGEVPHDARAPTTDRRGGGDGGHRIPRALRAARRRRRAVKRAAPLLAVALLGGCAYFNGIYNARQAERRADKPAARGRDGEAAGLYGTAAIKAETVLVRHAKSGWAHDALYLAGRGWAFSNQCERALPRLDAYLALPGQPAARRNRAALAIGMCNVRLGHHEVARDMLRPLLASRDHELTSAAAIWAARASIGVGETDSALAYLRSAGVAAAEWELATAYLGQRRHASAESLLVSRAQRGDFRREVLDAIGTLWAAGREKGVLRLTSAYDASRLRQVDRARLHLLVGDLLYGAGRDSAARQHFALSQRSGRDSLPGREASARLSELALRGLSSLPDVEAVIARTRDAAAGTALQRRLDENVVFVKILGPERTTLVHRSFSRVRWHGIAFALSAMRIRCSSASSRRSRTFPWPPKHCSPRRHSLPIRPPCITPGYARNTGRLPLRWRSTAATIHSSLP